MFLRATPRAVRARTRSLTLPTLAMLGAVLAVVAGMFVTLLVTSRSLDSTANSGHRAAVVQQDAFELEGTAVDLETGVRGYLLTRDRQYLEPYESARKRLSSQMHDLLSAAEPGQQAQLLAIRDELSEYAHDYTEPLVRGQ